MVNRAVTTVAVAAELGLPYVRVGGMLITQKKGDITEELADASAALSALGGSTPYLDWIDLSGLTDRRILVVVEKIHPTSDLYPRRVGIPKKRPIRSHDVSNNMNKPRSRGMIS